MESTQTPTQELIKKAMQPAEVIDDSGRIIHLRKPATLAQYRFVEMLGQSADSSTYMQMVMPLAYVYRIDDQPISIATKRELEALVKQLDEHGIKAVMDGVLENFNPANIDDQKDSIKKSQPAR